MTKLFVKFLSESICMMSDKDLYLLYRDYSKRKAQAFISGKAEDYKQLSNVVDMLKKEVLARC